MYKQNLHTHTTYTDGRNTPEEIIAVALARGFDSIGFSEHTLNAYSPALNQLTEEKTALYQKEIGELKEKYRGKLDIFCGLEYEFYSEVPQDGYDYLIGSVHYLECGGGVFGFDRGFDDTVADGNPDPVVCPEIVYNAETGIMSMTTYYLGFMVTIELTKN